MNKKQLGHLGFSHVLIPLIILVVLGVGYVGWKVQKDKQPKPATGPVTSESLSSSGIVMKSVGFHLDYYNEATDKAGDMQFTKIPLMFDQIWGDFGQKDPRTTDTTKKNPQPTYILPLGTKVEALVDGTVSELKELYSGDVTIWVQPEGSNLNFEHEHVSKPIVKKGDKVKSGQVIAEVSPHDSQTHPGFGLLEIGVLGQQGNRPTHTCPYQYLDPSVKDETLKKITSVHTAWEKYLGKKVYSDTSAIPGCVTLDPYVE